MDIANAAKVQVERTVVAIAGARRSGPTLAVITDIVEDAIVVRTITGSWVPDGTCRAELSGEVHAFAGTVV